MRYKYIEPKPEIKEKAYVYIITDTEGYVKIGITKQDVNARLKQLQTGHASKISIYYAEDIECSRNRLLKIEKLIHREVGTKYTRTQGEWFKLSNPNNNDELAEIKNIVVWNRIRYEQDDLYFKYGRLNPII